MAMYSAYIQIYLQPLGFTLEMEILSGLVESLETVILDLLASVQIQPAIPFV
jgi:hypothetical protein